MLCRSGRAGESCCVASIERLVSHVLSRRTGDKAGQECSVAKRPRVSELLSQNRAFWAVNSWRLTLTMAGKMSFAAAFFRRLSVDIMHIVALL